MTACAHCTRLWQHPAGDRLPMHGAGFHQACIDLLVRGHEHPGTQPSVDR